MSKISEGSEAYKDKASLASLASTERTGQKEASGLKRSGTTLDAEASYPEILSATMALFWPNFIARLAWIGMVTTDTALLGHAGTEYLTASSLSSFWTSIWGVFTSDSILGNYCGQAYGAKNYALVSKWCQVSVTIYSWVLMPIFILYALTAPALRYGIGTEPDVAYDAGYYSIVMAMCLYPKLIRGKMSSFFASQKITKPASQSTPIALILNLVFGLQFVLGIPYAGLHFGFWACPIVTTCVEWFLIWFYIYWYCGKCRYHEQCWTEEVAVWSPTKDVFAAPLLSGGGSERYAYYCKEIKPRLYEYFSQALPSTLAIGSDFWRMSAIGLLSGTLGNKQVAVFNSSYRLAWLNLTIIGSFSSACTTQMSIALGRGDGRLCKKVKFVSIVSCGIFLAVTTLGTVYFVTDLAKVFSSDPEVIEMYVSVRWEMALMIFTMCYAVIWESLLYACKRSDLVFYAALAGSWLGQVPAVVLLLQFSGKTLQNVYLGVGIGYGLLLVLYMILFLRIDIETVAREAYETNKVKEPLLEEKK